MNFLVALQFPLAHPAVAVTVPGAETAAEAAQCATWMREMIPAALWAELKRDGLLPALAPTPADAEAKL